MFAKVWIPRWAPFIAAAVLALISLEAWAPPGRAPYRPPSKPTYRPPPSRPIEPVEAQIYKVPPARKVPDFKADWSKLYRPSLTAQRHNLPGSDARAFWTSATNSLGKATTEIGSAFVLVRIFDDHVNLTTNFTQEGYSDAPVLSLKHADIANAEAMQRAIKELTGGIEPTETTQLKIVLDKDPNSSEFSSLFNKEDQTFRINTGKFTRAELFLDRRRICRDPERAAKGDATCVEAPDHRIGHSAGQRAVPGKAGGHQHAGHDRRTGAHRGGVPPTAPGIRLRADARAALSSALQRGGSQRFCRHAIAGRTGFDTFDWDRPARPDRARSRRSTPLLPDRGPVS